MRRFLGTLAALALVVAGCEAGDRADEAPVTDDTAAANEDSLAAMAPQPGVLTPINRSGIRGRAALESDDDEVSVNIDVTGLEPGVRYPAHVHEGRCVDGGPVALPLGRMTAQADSTGSIQMGIAADRLPDGADLFIQVHAPDGRPVACANVAARTTEDDPA